MGRRPRRGPSARPAESVESSSGLVLVIAYFSSRNFERLEFFQEIARKADRELLAMARDVYICMLHNLQSIAGSCTTEGLGIHREITDKSKRKWEQGTNVPG